MAKTRSIEIPKPIFKKLRALVEWYETTPEEITYFEPVDDQANALMANYLERYLDDDLCECFILRGRLYAHVLVQDANRPDDCIEQRVLIKPRS